MTMKNKVQLLFFFVFFIGVKLGVAAESTPQFNIPLIWLNKTLVENDWNYNVDEISFGILALKSKNYDVKRGVERLLEMQDADGSWNQNIQDTSLAIIALNFASKKEEIKKSISWLLSKQQEANTGGNWLLQIISTNEGDCEVSIENQGNPIRFVVNQSGVNCDYDGNGDGFGSWIDLERPDCGNFNIGLNDTVELNCNNLGRFDAYLIFRFANNYYLLSDKTNAQRRTTLSIANSFYGNYDDTLYASWALSEVGKLSSVYTLPYLSTNFRQDVVLDRAILYLITEKKAYIDYLRNVQNNLTGSFDRSVYTTSFGILALKREGGNQAFVNNALDWLDNSWIRTVNSPNYGSFDASVLDSAVALYAVFSSGRSGGGGISYGIGAGSAYCGDLIVNLNEQCDAKYGANASVIEGDARACKGSTKCVEPGKPGECTCKSIGTTVEPKENVTIAPEPECTSDFDCNIEQGEYCATDGNCALIEGYCDDDSFCTDDQKCDLDSNRCVKKGASYWWIITILVLLVAGLLVFLLAKKKGGIRLKKAPEIKKPPVFTSERPQVSMPQRKPTMAPPPRNYHDENLERELDVSIMKARELLKKKDKEK